MIKKNVLSSFIKFFAKTGKIVTNLFIFLGSFSITSFLVFKLFFKGKFELRATLHQLYTIGLKSLPLTTIIGFFVGMVITIQFGFGLKTYGIVDKVPSLVGYAMVRELGPIFIALLVGVKIASGYAAELGAMKVTEQIDAIKALGGNPIQQLVVPRVLAIVFILPLLTVWADIVSIIGGAIVSLIEYNMDPITFLKLVKKSIKNREILHGIIKSMVFAYMISIVASTKGINSGGGTKEVGKATTDTVEISFILIIITNLFMSKLFMVVKLKWLDILY